MAVRKRKTNPRMFADEHLELTEAERDRLIGEGGAKCILKGSSSSSASSFAC